MKRIVITGGSDGLGRALALALSAQGHKVVIVSPTEAKLREVAKQAGCTYQSL